MILWKYHQLLIGIDEQNKKERQSSDILIEDVTVPIIKILINIKFSRFKL